MADNCVEKTHSCVAAILLVGLSSQSVCSLQLCTWVLEARCSLELAAVQCARSRRWGAWWTGAECEQDQYQMNMLILGSSTLLLSSRGLAQKTIRCWHHHPKWSLQISWGDGCSFTVGCLGPHDNTCKHFHVWHRSIHYIQINRRVHY